MILPARVPAARRWLAAAGLLLSTAGLVGCSEDASVPPPSATATSAAPDAGEAQQVVADLEMALRAQDAAGAAKTGVAAAGPQLRAMVANVGKLGLTDLGLRYVDTAALDPAAADRFGPSAWEAVVEVSYRLPRWDAQATRVETPFVLVPDGDGQRIAAVGAPGGRTPLWMAGPVQVAAGERTLVISRSGLTPYTTLARRAVRDVGLVLHGWRGTLVLEVPASETELDQVLDAPQEQYANIAAVTAAVDGTLARGAPVHVFVNPRVFSRIGPRGSQVVLSHETTHVATGATFAVDLPTWLLEGFADYVALAHADIPVRTAASQILARIRKQGAPDHLPTAHELDPTATGLGATYEEAWLATRFLAAQHGEAKLVAFYRAVDRGTPVTTAFASVLGTTEAAFTKRWRADLLRLAGGEPG
ncbi:MAG: hypothetical protein J7518_04310 [Nocardioidaceae bacterium]|nr:hypothetical protein [Nocardioidaceae bacterium]